jgi:hypothetical protein
MPDKKTLVMDFGKPVAWMGLGKRELLAWIEVLKQKADEMEFSDEATSQDN